MRDSEAMELALQFARPLTKGGLFYLFTRPSGRVFLSDCLKCEQRQENVSKNRKCGALQQMAYAVSTRSPGCGV